MPLYEYQCASCQKVHEVMQKFSDAPMATCPDCNGSVSKLISMSSFALKGSGWYTTDYKGKSASSAATKSMTEAGSATATAAATAAPAPASATSSKSE